MLSFKDYLAEAKSDNPDGVKYLDHRNVWVVYSGGKIITTKKTKEAAEAYVTKKAGNTPAPKASPVQKKVEAPKDEPEYDEVDGPDNPEEPAKIESLEHEIPTHNLEFLEKKIAKLNKTAAKLGCAPIILEKGEPYQKRMSKVEDPDHIGYFMDGSMIGVNGVPVYKEFIKVKVKGEAPKLAGWSFVGKREPLEGTKDTIMAKSAPGQKLPKKFMGEHDLTCEHCKKRAYRTATFVVKKGRKYMEVGRSCLKDFLGHNDPNGYANYAEVLCDIDAMMGSMEDEDYGGGGRSGPSLYETKQIVAAAIHQIKNKGFVSNQYAGERASTSMVVNQHFNPPRPMPHGMSYEADFKIPYTPEEEAEAVKVIDWLKNHPKATKEEFWNNLSKIASSEAVSLRQTGYLAAGANMHLKETSQVKKTEGMMKTIKDEGFGKPDDKVKIEGTVISSFAYQSQGQWGGTKHIVTVKSDSGHLIKMFTASGDSGVKKDARVTISGKIGKVEKETYDRSPFKGMTLTVMAPRTRIESQATEAEADAHYHVGDKVKFKREGKSDGVGVITAKPTYGRFEISPVSGRTGEPIHVKFDDIITKV